MGTSPVREQAAAPLRQGPRAKAATAALAALLLLVGGLLNGPLFMEGEMPYRDSIEGGYASMVRFIWAHPNPWGWNPYQYGGLPTQFMYLPLPMYAGAALAWITGVQPEYAHRLLSSTLTLLGPVTMFAFVLYFTGRRWWAFGTALAYSLACPLYGLTLVIGNDRGYAQVPWRLQVLVKYGEGPHNMGLALIPLALIAVWLAATRRGFRTVFLAAAALAAVALTNWIAALALAICCILLILSGFRAPEFEVTRVAASGVLGYLLACFWLTPTFVQTMAFNWPVDAFNYKLRLTEWLMLAGLTGGIVLIRLCYSRIGDWYLTFLILAVFTFGWLSLGFYWAGLNTIPESRRYVLEFSFFLFVAGFEVLRRLVTSRRRALQIGAIAAAVAIFTPGQSQARLYVGQGWQRWQPFPKERTVEHRLAKWISGQEPEGRVFASGGVRFRLNSWFEIPQVGGTFESGLRNRLPLRFSYQIRTGKDSEPGEAGHDAVLQLRAMAAEYAVVTGPGSKEHYRDMANPSLFEGLLDRVYAEEHEWIYRVPFTSYAHQMARQELPPLTPDGSQIHVLEPYVAAMGEHPLRTQWKGPSELTVDGPVDPAMPVATRINFDEGWAAVQGGRVIPTERDALGYVLVQPQSADAIELQYQGTPEQRLAAIISGLAWVLAIWYSVRPPRPARRTVFQHP